MAEEKVAGRREEELPPEKSKKYSPILLILVSMSVLLLVETGYIAWHFGGILLGGKPAKAAESTAPAETVPQDSEVKENDKKADAGEETKADVVEGLLAIEPFTVNLADKEESHYMRLSLKLGMDSKSAAEKVAQNELLVAKVRDAVLGVISAMTAPLVLSKEGKATLRQEIIRHVNDVIKTGKVVEVYFLELVVQ